MQTTKAGFLVAVCVLFLGLCLPAQAQDEIQTDAYCVHCPNVYSLAWSPKGDLLAVGGDDGLWLYDTTGKTIAHLANAGPLEIAWNSSGTLLAYGDGPDKPVFVYGQRIYFVSVWDVQHQRLKRSLNATTTYPTFSWSGNRNILAYTNGDSINLWNADTDSLQTAPNFTFEMQGADDEWPRRSVGAILRVVWSPDGTRIAAITRGTLVGGAPEPANQKNYLRIWNVQTETIERSFETFATEGDPLLWKPDSSAVLLIDIMGETRLYDMQTGYAQQLDLDSPRTAAWSSDGAFLATDASDMVRIWDTKTWQIEDEVGDRQKQITVVAWSPTRNSIAAADRTGNVWVWPTNYYSK